LRGEKKRQRERESDAGIGRVAVQAGELSSHLSRTAN